MGNTLVIEQKISITRLQKGWTRYGGANNGYHIREERKDWNCQACGEDQPPQLSAYLFPFLESEVLRICSMCQNLVTSKEISVFDELVTLVRKHMELE